MLLFDFSLSNLFIFWPIYSCSAKGRHRHKANIAVRVGFMSRSLLTPPEVSKLELPEEEGKVGA